MLLELQQRMGDELAQKKTLFVNNCLSAIISSLQANTVKSQRKCRVLME
jgi:hypothetical protein